VHVRVVDTASSRVLVSDQLTGDLATLMQQVQPLNRRLARALGAADSPGLSYPARAWEAYDQALAMADAGRHDEAIRALQALLGQSPNFHPAERQLVALLQKATRR
jgi:hypothetical protein